jgi:hypothetical protein
VIVRAAKGIMTTKQVYTLGFKPLEIAARSACTSQSGPFSAQDLEAVLLTGIVRDAQAPYVRAFLQEAKESLLDLVVEQLREERGLTRAMTWSVMKQLAGTLQCHGPLWTKRSKYPQPNPQ